MEQESDFAMVNRAVPQKGSRELKVEDALLYLDQVKMEFSDQPKIYNEFLEIMKNFKAQSITTPGVIDQVKQLFKGHNKLILGFNTFLPEGEGYKIELSPEEEAYPQHLQQQHAISYVTNIRTRFASEPEIYKAFLKILHTYQREQKGIKDVLDQVSALFADHPDLLMDFTYFLPDAVQEQAKERLRAAVSEIESKKKNYQSQKRRGETYRNERETKAAKNAQNLDVYANINSNQTNQKKSARSKKLEMNSQQYDKDERKEEKDKVNNYTHFYHTITTERKFFDQVKELLTNSSRDAWTEFVKCLDLFSHDALSKKEVILLAQELFGPGNEDLLDEFKVLISSRSAYDSSKQDMWFSIPLTEIDFSQCRRCTPSYRILPSDYPKRICSGGRGLKESSVLNDEWVSIPIGSEESFAFKQMRKNQYEEAIFRSEDERFEVDMVIDSNCTCIRVLEAMTEEFTRLKNNDESHKIGIELDKPSLGVIHLNVISRLYGEHGQEILDALRRNPVGTIPVILKRLKQKDVEWREARHRMQIQWKDILMKNYDKSLDHRSYVFKPQDKRSYTTRFLVNDIKDVPTTDVKEGRVPQVSYTCTPEISALSKGMQPQLYLTYTSSDRIALLDVYHLLSYAAETSSCSSMEKERMSALWRDLFRVILNMPVHYLFSPSSIDKLQLHYSSQVRKRINIEEHEEPERRTSRHQHQQQLQQQQLLQQTAHSFWPIGTRVVTIYGVGYVTGLNKETEIHEVTLSYGKGYFPLATIVGAESLSNNALEAIGVSRTENGKEYIVDINVTNDPQEERVFSPSCLLYGTQMCYIFLRLHHTLTLRLAEARQFASETGLKKKKSGSRYLSFLSNSTDTEDIDDETDLDAIGENITHKDTSTGSVYAAYLSQLYSFIDGTIDATRYEDNTRNILGGHAYALSSIDKIVQQCIKCLQALSSDDITHRLVGIFLYHNFSPQFLQNGTCPTLYRDHVANCLKNTLEDVYRLQFISPSPQTGEMVVACQYLGVLPIHTSSISSSLQDSVQKAPKLVLADDDDDEAQELPSYRLDMEQSEEESEHDSIQLDGLTTYEKNERKISRRRRNHERDDDLNESMNQTLSSSSVLSPLTLDNHDNKDIFPSTRPNLFDNILQAAAEESNTESESNTKNTSNNNINNEGKQKGSNSVKVKQEEEITATTVSKGRYSSATRSSRKK